MNARNRARAEFALSVLQRQRAATDAAIVGLEKMQAYENVTDAAIQVVGEIGAAERSEIAEKEAEEIARLSPAVEGLLGSGSAP